jgi:hypothetical protein
LVLRSSRVVSGGAAWCVRRSPKLGSRSSTNSRQQLAGSKAAAAVCLDGFLRCLEPEQPPPAQPMGTGYLTRNPLLRGTRRRQLYLFADLSPTADQGSLGAKGAHDQTQTRPPISPLDSACWWGCTALTFNTLLLEMLKSQAPLVRLPCSCRLRRAERRHAALAQIGLLPERSVRWPPISPLNHSHVSDNDDDQTSPPL